MPSVVAASTHLLSSANWEPREKDLKKYLHFDRSIGKDELSTLANDPAAVARHAFFPLIRFHETWTKFRRDGKRTKKVRPLRYAARIDAAIYSRYRSILSMAYEEELTRRSLLDVPVAYRKLPKSGGGNKCNIEISRDVFSFIKRTGDCVVTVVDIKSYFESLSHYRIKETWEMLLGSPMSADHAAVYRNLTRYSVVDYDKIITRLKLYEKPFAGSRVSRRRRVIDDMKSSRLKQLCTPADFRKLIAGSDPSTPSLIQKNGFNFGIPQGTPISDLVANFYLIDFDHEINKWVNELGGLYRRYSDDIIVVLPAVATKAPLETKTFLQERIQHYGDRLIIQDKKVSVVRFERLGSAIKFSHVFGSSSRNGLEYLGFEYDGNRVKIRNSTLSNAWRKMKRQAYGHAASFVKRYREKGKSWIISNYPAQQMETHILRDVTYKQDEGYKSWTFIKYVRRSSRAFIGFNPIFSAQTKKYRYYTKLMIQKSLQKALDVHLK
ncbi:hypothetical protein I3J13_10410 [Agrobacterium sp. MOPV5]|uniref:hypothetical protein n=1 Tax=Agrobacterium leguminum TaxID=2792015 RepID=UPI0018C32BA1|nr:hypothetical protein [Agrobacterium leguminum]MBG0509174.1 hypothetical protein [Agrobacterium leguminum]